MFKKAKIYFQESKQELKKVNWPTKKETISYTLFVIVFALLVAAFLGVLDFGFLKGLETFILGR